MTHPSDIAGLSERLRRTLGSIEPKDFDGDNLAVFIASELEPLIEDETLDDSGTWKQGAIDACDRVLDAVHAHYVTALDSLSARVKELEAELFDTQAALGGVNRDWNKAMDRALRAEQQQPHLSPPPSAVSPPVPRAV